MQSRHLLAAVVSMLACVFLQACSDSDDSGASDKKAPPPVAAPPQGQRPALPAPLPAAPRTSDACALLTIEDVEQVIGKTMEGPEIGPAGGGGKGEGKMSSCSFASKSDADNAAPADVAAELNSTWVRVTVWHWPEGGQSARNFINAMRDAPMTGEPVKEIKGLAEEAVWNGALHARKGNVTISVDVRPSKAAKHPDEQAKERALMEKALERL